MAAVFILVIMATLCLSSGQIQLPNLIQGQITCSSNVNAPNQCQAPGRIVEAWVAQQTSSQPCRVYSTFGFVSNYLWVQRGCAGQFTIVYQLTPGSGNNQIQPVPTQNTDCQPGETIIFCLSSGVNDYRECRLSLVVTSVTLNPQFQGQQFQGQCRENFGYGISQNRSAIWTNRGCQGVFDVTYQICPVTTQVGCPTYQGTVQCGSSSFQYNECSAPVEVTSLRERLPVVPTASSCIQNQSFGRLTDGVWVSRRCRGAFDISYRVCRPNTNPLNSFNRIQ